MAWLTFARKLRGAVRTSTFERGLDAELQHHLALETERHIRLGMDPVTARDIARREFGSLARVKDECRDSWGLRALEAFVQDVRFGLRYLSKFPSYTIVVLMTLALGIGASTALFSVVHAVLLRALPYANGDRLVEVRQRALRTGVDNAGLSPKDMEDYRAQSTSLDALVEYHQMSFNLLGTDTVSRVTAGVVSPEFFDVIGVTPILGRTFRAEDDLKDAPAVLIISHAYWRNVLGGDPGIIGRTFEMNDRVHTVVGVLPPAPLYPNDNDVYMPTSACPFRSNPRTIAARSDGRMVQAIGRLRRGATLESARADVALVERRLAAAYPADYPADAGFSATALSVRDELTRRAQPTLWILLAITGFVLVLVSANVANLTLARLAWRDRELSLRAALGAGRGRIARQLLTESALLALGGGVLGLGFAYLVRDLLVTFTAAFTPRATEIVVDPTVMLFALGVSIVTGLLSGVMPAFTRTGTLRESEGRRTVGATADRARTALVVGQVAISFVLLIGAGLLVRSFVKLQRVDAGYRADRVLTMQISLDFMQYRTAADRLRFYLPLMETLRSEPGVRAVAVSLNVPLDAGTPFNRAFVAEGQVAVDGQPRPHLDFKVASPEYFDTVGMSVLHGRAFTDADGADAPAVAIVNLSLARHQFDGPDAVGRRVSLDGGSHWTTIVGVVNDVKEYGLDVPPTDALYTPFAQTGFAESLLVRTAGDPMAMVRTIQADVRAIDPRQPISRIRTLEDVRRKSLESPRLTTVLVSLFALVALIITAAGIAGVLSLSVNHRTTEIGVRMALGARRSAVVGMVVRQGLAPVGAGLVLGMAAAMALTQLAVRVLFEVQPTDPLTYASVIVVLTAIAALACFAPARRAAAINPLEALRAN